MKHEVNSIIAYTAAIYIAFAGVAFGAAQVRQTVDPQHPVTLIEKDCRPYEKDMAPGSKYKGVVHPCTVIL